MKEYVGVIVSVVGVLSIFVEVSKIKFNPWGMLFDFIGKSLTREVRKELGDIRKILAKQSDSLRDIEMLVDLNEIKRIRAEIFAFADSCKVGEEHTEDAFLHIIDIHGDYIELLEKYDMSNGRISMEYEYIMEKYKAMRQ